MLLNEIKWFFYFCILIWVYVELGIEDIEKCVGKWFWGENWDWVVIGFG